MLSFFIAIVLIAEIIITCQIVSFILKIDSKVCELNEKITAITPQIERGFLNIRIALNRILLAFNKFEQKLYSQKEKFKFTLLKNLVTIALFLILNVNAKKVLSVLDLAFETNRLIKKVVKTFV